MLRLKTQRDKPVPVSMVRLQTLGRYQLKTAVKDPPPYKRRMGSTRQVRAPTRAPCRYHHPPPIPAKGGQDTAGVDGRGKRKRGRRRGKTQTDTGPAPPAENTTIKQTGGDAPIATASHDPTQNKQGGHQGCYNLRRACRSNYAAYFDDAEDDDADM